MGFNLGHWLEETWADVNPFDNGRSGATVRQQRSKPAPARTVRGSSPSRPGGMQMGRGVQPGIQQNQAQRPSFANTLTAPLLNRPGTSIPRPTMPSNKIKIGENGYTKNSDGSYTNAQGQRRTQKQIDSLTGIEKRYQQRQKQIDANAVTPQNIVRDVVNSAVDTGKKAYYTAETAGKSIGSIAPALEARLSGNQARVRATDRILAKSIEDSRRNSFIPSNVTTGRANPVEFAKSFTDAGVEVAGLLPAGRVLSGAQKVGGLTRPLVKDVIKTNAKQAGVYGTAFTGNDVMQGRGITPESLATNYGAPFVLGAGAEFAGVGGRQLGHRLNEGGRSMNRAMKVQLLKAATDKQKPRNASTNLLKTFEGAPDRARIDEYKALIQSGQPIEPLIVMRGKDGSFGVEDGKHRLQALNELGITKAPVRVATPEGIKKTLEGGFAAVPGRQRPDANGGIESAKSSSSDGSQSPLPPTNRLDAYPTNSVTPEPAKRLDQQLSPQARSIRQQQREKMALESSGSMIRDTGIQPQTDRTYANYTTKSPVDPLESLKQEARKYKNVNEFVRAQPLSYHGTTENLKKFNSKQGTWFTDDYMNADGYANGVNVYEGKLNLINPLVIDGKGKKWDNLNTKYGKSTREIVGNVDSKKHDGVIFKNIKDNWIDDADAQDPGTVTYAFDPTTSFMNESQLTDLYNQAHSTTSKSSVQSDQRPTRQVAPEETMTSTDSPQLARQEQASKTPAKTSKEQTAPSSSSNNTPLPTFNTTKVKAIDKVFRSTRSIIERQGEKGKQLADTLQKARDDEELFQAALLKQMPTTMKLKSKDFENFVDATQGQATPANAKVAKAVKEWQATHPQIRERAAAAGLNVGDLGPTYYPHFIDYDRVFKNKNTYNEAINHLVKTGQAKSTDEAIKLLTYARDTSRNRTFGNLEASRVIDLPFYDKTNNSFRQYIQSATRRIAQTENFGAKDEHALKLIGEAGADGFDTEAMKNAYDIAVGARKYSPSTEKASRNIRRYVTTTRLGLGALTNVSQSVNTGIVTGHLRTLKSMVKQLDPKMRSYVEDTGVIADAVINDIRSQQGFESFGKSLAGKVTNAVTAPGFGAVEKFNRAVAATAGRDYALRLAQKGDIATLKKLGVKGDIKNNTLTKTQQIQASRKIVEKTQFKVDAQDLPGWVDSPGGKMVAQFRTFSYNQSKFFSNEILKPAAKGNLKPLARMMAALPLGYALYEARRAIDGRPEEEDKVKVGVESFGKIGGAGLAFDIYKSLNPVGGKYLPPDRRTSMAVGAIGGPAVGIGSNLVGAVSEAVQKKSIPKSNPDLEGKVAVRSGEGDGEGYNDLTSLTRLGIQQIPVVGAPIANRVLPYKKQSEADNKSKVGQSPTERAALSRLDNRLDDIPQSVSSVSKNVIAKYYGMKEPDREKWFVKEKDAEYKFWKAKYEVDKAQGKISKVEEVKWKYNLAKDKIGAKYSKDSRDALSLSKEKVSQYVSSTKNPDKVAQEIYDYDKRLYEAGLSKYRKFKNGLTYAVNTGKSSGNLKGYAKTAASKNGVPENVFAALIQQESGGNQNATSPVGARGLTQLMPATAKGLGVDPDDPKQNLEGGARYLAQQYKTFGSWELALAAYNAGPGAVQQYGGVPPFPETQNYVRSIMGAIKQGGGIGNLGGGGVVYKTIGGDGSVTVSSAPPMSSGRSRGGRRSGGGRAKSKKGKFDYKLFGFDSKGKSNSKDLYDMVKKAQVKRQKKLKNYLPKNA